MRIKNGILFKISIVMLTIVVLLIAYFIYSSFERNQYKNFVNSESSWLAFTQLDNGVFPDYDIENGTVDVIPYNSDFVALALLESDSKYSDNVKSYMNWYFAHMNSSASDINGLEGTVYDYKETVGSDNNVIYETITTQR